MTTLLKPSVRPSEEDVQDVLSRGRELVADLPSTRDVGIHPGSRPRRLADHDDLIGAARRVAEALYACWDLAERIEVYTEVGTQFGSDARRVLNLAAARWPEMISMVNDMPEWKALLSADVS